MQSNSSSCIEAQFLLVSLLVMNDIISHPSSMLSYTATGRTNIIRSHCVLPLHASSCPVRTLRISEIQVFFSSTEDA